MENEPPSIAGEDLCHLLTSVFEEHSDALFVKDLNGKYLICNQVVGRLVGKPVDEILGRDDRALFDAEGAQKVMNRDRRVLETGRSETEEEVLTADGVTRIYQATKTPYRDSQGKIRGVIGISRDITERRRAEVALKHSEHTLRLVLDSLPVGVQVMDLQGDIVLGNPAAEMIWGKLLHLGDERYQRVRAWFYDDKTPVESSQWASLRALDRGEETHGERLEIEAFDGVRRVILNSAVPIRDTEQKIIGAVIINEDITQSLRLEQQFLQAQKMEAIGHLAGGVAHDFNNLLTVVSGYGELLLQVLSPTDPNKELVEPILEAAEKASGLTKKLLAFSRQSVLNPKIVDLNEVVGESEKMLRRLIGEDIVFQLELEARPCYVKVDPGQLEQALMNLCINGRDAMPGGGNLLLRTSLQDPDLGLVALEVRDTGDGIRPEIKERIFEPFFTTKSPGKGTGLGLATVYGFVQQSGGQIGLESQLGQGTSFKILLPVVDSLGSETPAQDLAQSPQLGEELILLVEDQEALRSMLTMALQKAGYSVLQASQGVDALGVWNDREGEGIQLLLTDVVMPEMGGWQLAEKLREIRPELKVLFMSGHTDDAVLRHGVEQSQVAFIQKPFSLEALTLKIREVLDGDS